MIIYYTDEIGENAVEIDFNNIQFLNGECYFSSNGEEYRIKTENIIEIITIKEFNLRGVQHERTVLYFSYWWIYWNSNNCRLYYKFF